MNARLGPISGPLTPVRPLNARKRRQVLEAAVERLLGAVEAALADLDAIDGDADLEPSLGAPERHPTVPRRDGFISYGGGVDPSQERWAQGAADDREEEHDGREPQCEDEGAQCEDEGIDSDAEPNDWGFLVPDYGDDGHGGQDQRQCITCFGRWSV